VIAQVVTAEFFPILGVSPLIGRTFTDAENRDPQSNVVVLGYEFWKRSYVPARRASRIPPVEALRHQ
jgi:MacB-like periplasmic core domain